MRECPACKRTYKEGEAGHKLLCYDIPPNWGFGPRIWICEITVEAFRGLIKQFDANTDPHNWWNPHVKVAPKP